MSNLNLTTPPPDGVSILKNPFNKECVTGISIIMSVNGLGRYWWANVEFINGNTKGEQKFRDYKEDEFARLVQDIQNFINSL